MRIIFLLALLLLPAAAALADPLFPDMKTARLAADAGDYEDAAAHRQALADFGIPEAQLELAELYADGKGVPQNPAEAFRLTALSAEAGLPRAYLALGRLYEDGIGTPRDVKHAQFYFTRARDAGDPRGAFELGRLYERNPDIVPAAAPPALTEHMLRQKIEGGQLAYAEELALRYTTGKRLKEKEAALMYMTIAARNGSSTAALRADTMKQGLEEKSILRAEKEAEELIVRIRAPGFTEAAQRAKYTRAEAKPKKASLSSLALPERDDNYREAAKLYREAMDDGYLRAARSLGQLYEKGRGVKKDKVQALAHYYIARDSGSEGAIKSAVTLETTLNPQDIARARSDADTVLAAHPAPPGKNPFEIAGIVKNMAIAEENADLGTRSDTLENALAVDARAGMAYMPSSDMRLYGEMRAYTSSGLVTVDDDDNDTASRGFAELTQFWAEFYNLFDNPVLSAKIGRQRFREDRGFWWNDDIDALRFSLDSTLTSGFISVGQSFDDYRIGENDSFREDEQDRLRVFGELSRRWHLNHRIEGRFLYENDHSGAENTGSIVATDNWDREDFNLLWLGGRAAGDVPTGDATISYRLDGAIVNGEETVTDTTGGPGGGQRTVTGRRDRDVFGWAVDGGVDVALPSAPLSPTLSLGYAHGSGESNTGGTGDDGAFRQTGLENNTSVFGDDTVRGRLRNYGEVLRPELSNIHILSAGAQISVLEQSRLSLTYFNYWLDEKTGALRSPGINAPLNGTDAHLGQAMDMALYVPLAPELGMEDSFMDNVSSRFIVGGFKAGDAFGVADDEYAWRGTAELRVRF